MNDFASSRLAARFANPGRRRFRMMRPKLFVPLPEPQNSQDSALRLEYESNPELKARADKLHESRLQTGPACDECIALAMKALPFQS